jgi:hypothetical protein
MVPVKPAAAEDERKKARQGFAQEALASWAGYQETGLSLTIGEMTEWLESWGRERKNGHRSGANSHLG